MSIESATADLAANGPWWARKDVVAVTAGLIVVVSVLLWWSLNIRLQVVDWAFGGRPPPLMTIPLLIGLAAVAYGIVTGRRFWLAVVLTPLLAGALLMVAPYRMYAPKLWFVMHKPMYEAALAVDPGTNFYGVPLPGFKRFSV